MGVSKDKKQEKMEDTSMYDDRPPNNQPPFEQPPYQKPQYGRKPASASMILSIILIVIGIIAGIVGSINIIAVTLMPNSVIAYYFRDFDENGLLNIYSPFIFGIILIVTGIIILIIRRIRARPPKT